MALWIRNFVLLALMLAASAGAVALRPTYKLADHGPKVVLETLIPQNFGDWREEQQLSAQIVDPQQKEMIDRIYNQTLSRLYVNAKGYRIMLSIAYGGDQSDAMQVHKPEVCYPAQGFEVLSKTSEKINSPLGPLPVTHISTRLGERREPVTYWIRVGDQLVQGGMQKKLVEMRYGVAGSVPDGLLFRVSSIDPDNVRAYEIQADFVSQLLGESTPEQRRRLIGSFGEN